MTGNYPEFDKIMGENGEKLWMKVLNDMFPLRLPESVTIESNDKKVYRFDLDQKKLSDELRSAFSEMPKEDLIRLLLGVEQHD